MRSLKSTWFECKIQYEKLTEDGVSKKVKEDYAVEALSFTDAEAKITEEAAYYIHGDFEVVAIKKAKYDEVFFTDSTSDDLWYKSTLQFITLDEKSGKEKKTNVVYLIQAANLDAAVKNIDEVMKGSISDYNKFKVEETQILDVFSKQ